eukprot:1408477-Lingulodinium_polyedra.AAC.1
MAALNWCFGRGAGALRGGGADSAAISAELQAVARKRVLERGRPPGDLTQEEAARALLRSRAGYDPSSSNVAAFVPGRVALPG